MPTITNHGVLPDMRATADKPLKEYYGKPSLDFIRLLEASKQYNRIMKAMILARCKQCQ